jgi:TP901 family phage tail tape measure protein
VAKQTQHQFDINVRQATRSVAALGRSVDSYNTKVKEGAKAQSAYTKEGKRAIKVLDDLRAGVSIANSVMDRHTTALVNNREALSRNTRAVNSNVNAQVQLATNTRLASFSLSTLANSGQKTRISMNGLNSEVILLTRNVQTEIGAVRGAIGSLNAFSKSIDIINARMNAKNGLLARQTQLVQRDTKATNELTISWRGIARLLVAQTLHRAFFFMTNGIRDAIKEARDLSLRIAEIQTITQQNALSTQQWEQQLRSLSTAFGVDILEVAEGTYQAISNQVVTAGAATQFMTEEMKLAITTVSTLRQAVDATSSVLNAYKLGTQEAGQVNAVLFETVNLGRIRLEELGSGFGRLNVISNQLGVSFLEQQSALAVLTTKGIEADTAMTLLQNVMLKLIKPTKGMSEILAELGVSSGKAAIETFGFFGILRKIAEMAEKAGDETSELGEIFRDMRAIVGAQGLTQSFGELESTLKRLQEAQTTYSKAVSLSMEAEGRRVLIQTEKIKQFFITQFGQPILRTSLQIAEAFGGADKALSILLKGIVRAIALYGSYRAALFAVNVTQAIFARNLFTSVGRMRLLIGACNALGISLRVLQAAEAGATLGLTLLIGLLAEAYIRTREFASEVESAGLNARMMAEELTNANFEEFTENVDRAFTKFDETLEGSLQIVFKFMAAVQAENNALTAHFEAAFKKNKKIIEETTTVALAASRKEIVELRREVDRLLDAADKARGKAFERGIEDDFRRFDAAIGDLPEIDRARRIAAEKIRLHREGLAAEERGERELAEKLLDRARALADEEIELLKKIEEKAREHKEKIDVSAPTVRLSGKGKATVTTKRTVKTVEAPDIDAATAAATRRKAVEEEITAMVKERIAAEIAFAERSEKAAAKKEADAAKREEGIRIFAAALTRLDAFNEKDGDPRDFSGRLAEAEKAAAAAGLSEKERLEFLRTARAQEIQLRRKAAVEAANAELEINREALEEAKKREIEASTRREKALKDNVAGINQFIVNTEAELGKLDKVFEVSFRDNKAKADKKREAQEEIKDLRSLLELLNKKNKTGEVDLKLVEQIETKYKSIIALLAAAEQQDLTKDAQKIGSFTVPGTKFDKHGNKIVDQKAIDALREQRDALNELKVAVNGVAEANRGWATAQATLREVEIILHRLPEEFRKLGVDSAAGADAGVKGQQALHIVLDETIDRLERIRNIQADIKRLEERDGRPVGGNPGGAPGFALGGNPRGTDIQPAYLDPEETIMNRFASRNFGPLLNAMNHVTNNSTTIGDIHIHPAHGTSDQQIREIAAGLRRLDRRGVSSRRGR